MPCTSDFNFIDSKTYTQVEIAAEGSQMSAQTAEQTCSQHADRNARDFFYQQHTNGYTICGFYDDPLVAADVDNAVKHGHNFGGICNIPPNLCPCPPSSFFNNLTSTAE